MADIKPHWKCIALDSTRHWRIAPEDTPFIEKILTVYIVNTNEVTHLCEATPSYFLIFQAHSIVTRGDVSEDVRERLNTSYELEPGEDTYMHARDVDALPAEQVKTYGEPQDLDVTDDGEEEVREHYNGNPVF